MLQSNAGNKDYFYIGFVQSFFLFFHGNNYTRKKAIFGNRDSLVSDSFCSYIMFLEDNLFLLCEEEGYLQSTLGLLPLFDLVDIVLELNNSPIISIFELLNTERFFLIRKGFHKPPDILFLLLSTIHNLHKNKKIENEKTRIDRREYIILFFS